MDRLPATVPRLPPTNENLATDTMGVASRVARIYQDAHAHAKWANSPGRWWGKWACMWREISGGVQGSKKWILERSDKRSFCLAEATGVRCSLDKEPSPIQGGPLRTIYYKAHAASENAVSAVKLSSSPKQSFATDVDLLGRATRRAVRTPWKWKLRQINVLERRMNRRLAL